MLLFAATGLALVAVPQGLADEPKWELVWRDEFDDSRLDYTRWGVEVNALGGGNHELQFYTDREENVRVENGQLVIEARKDNYSSLGTTRLYSSGRLRTKHRGDWKYGRVEVRAKLPSGRGIWPAIWLLPTHEKYGTWAASGEIDIMEMLGHEPNKVYGTLHYGSTWPRNEHAGGHYVLPKGSFADDFHVFAVEWEEGRIRWYVDGKLYQTQTKWHTDAAPFPAPFDQPFHLILNVAVGGEWPGAPDEQTQFPQRMLVDYVRVYQRRRDLTSRFGSSDSADEMVLPFDRNQDVDDSDVTSQCSEAQCPHQGMNDLEVVCLNLLDVVVPAQSESDQELQGNLVGVGCELFRVVSEDVHPLLSG